MPNTKRERLSGWGHTSVEECLSFRPEKQRDVRAIIHDPNPIIARGLGRSYGDASLQPTGTVRTERLNHFIHFDTEKGIVTAQAGVTLAELIELAVPQGWFPHHIPGSRHITLGGAFACNVHGKNHYREGDFAEKTLSIRLVIANGDTIECSPTVNSDLFWATAGGMGMTGIIEQITLQLKPIASSSLTATTYRVDSLDDMFAAFEHFRETSDYMVGWIDHMAKGDAIGRGIFEAATHTSLEEGGTPLADFKPSKKSMNVPCFLPPFVLNRYTMALYNLRRFKKYSFQRRIKLLGR